MRFLRGGEGLEAVVEGIEVAAGACVEERRVEKKLPVPGGAADVDVAQKNAGGAGGASKKRKPAAAAAAAATTTRPVTRSRKAL